MFHDLPNPKQMPLENNNLFSKSTHQSINARLSPKLKKGSESNGSSETINIDPYLLSIKLKKAIPSIDKDISDLNETICHLIYSNKTLAKEAKIHRSRSRKLQNKPPIVLPPTDKEKSDFDENEKNNDSPYESNLKSRSTNKVFEMNRLSREAKFHLEKKRAELIDRSMTRMSREGSRSRKYRAQSTGIIPHMLEPNFNIHFHQNKNRDTSSRRGVSVHSRSRAGSNLRAASRANFTGSRHKIQIDNLPDFPIPLPDESSEFLVLPPKHFYQMPPVEKIKYDTPKVNHHHKPHHQQHHQKNYPQSQPVYHAQHQEQVHQNYYPQHQLPQSQQIPQPQIPQHPQPQIPQQMPIPQQIQQHISQQNGQQLPQQQFQIELSPQQAQQFLNSSPAQQAEMIGQLQQQVISSIPQNELIQHMQSLMPQQQQQNMGVSPAQQLEMTLQQLQNLYINQNAPGQMEMFAHQQFQQQSQPQQELAAQQQLQHYLALQSQGQQQVDMLKQQHAVQLQQHQQQQQLTQQQIAQQQLVQQQQQQLTQQQIAQQQLVQQQQQMTKQQQIQNLLNLQQSNAAIFKQSKSKQFFNPMAQEIQIQGIPQVQGQQQYYMPQQQQQQQEQYINYNPENQAGTPSALKNSKTGINFLGMVFEQPNQVQFQ